MKFGTKILALLAAVVLAGGGFSAGRYVEDQENMQIRQQRKRKDTNFKANHNNNQFIIACFSDVCLSAKIRILKQITTPLPP